MATKRTQDIDLGITRFEYGDKDRPQRATLTIETDKYYNGGVISDADVFWVGNHSRSRLLSLGGPNSDYSKRLKLSDRSMKATQRNIDAQHAEVFTAEVIADLTQAARDHYGAAVRAGCDSMKNTGYILTAVAA